MSPPPTKFRLLLWLSPWRICLQCWRPGFDPWSGKIPWRRERLPTPVFWPRELHRLYSPWGPKKSDRTERLSLSFLGFPCGSAGKESACNVGDLGSIPELGKSPGEWNSYPFQYSYLENSMDCIVHGITKSQTWLSDFHFWYISKSFTIFFSQSLSICDCKISKKDYSWSQNKADFDEVQPDC